MWIETGFGSSGVTVSEDSPTSNGGCGLKRLLASLTAADVVIHPPVMVGVD